MADVNELRENDLIREIIRLKSFVHKTFCEQGHHHRNCKSAHRLINSDDFRDQTAMIFEDIAVRKEEHQRALLEEGTNAKNPWKDGNGNISLNASEAA